MRTNYHAKFEEGQTYHVYNRTNGKDFLFLQEGNYIFFLNKWKQYINPYFDIYAYCLMGNHFHFIIQVRTMDAHFIKNITQEGTVAALRFLEQTLSVNEFLEDQFKRFFNAYAAAFNKQQKRHGSLFQKRFRRVQIIGDDKLRTKICYVHHNPIHHDLSYFYETWRYSSYKAYTSSKQTTIEKKKGLLLFDKEGQIERFIDIHEKYKRNRTGFLGDEIERDF